MYAYDITCFSISGLYEYVELTICFIIWICIYFMYVITYDIIFLKLYIIEEF